RAGRRRGQPHGRGDPCAKSHFTFRDDPGECRGGEWDGTKAKGGPGSAAGSSSAGTPASPSRKLFRDDIDYDVKQTVGPALPDPPPSVAGPRPCLRRAAEERVRRAQDTQRTCREPDQDLLDVRRPPGPGERALRRDRGGEGGRRARPGGRRRGPGPSGLDPAEPVGRPEEPDAHSEPPRHARERLAVRQARRRRGTAGVLHGPTVPVEDVRGTGVHRPERRDDGRPRGGDTGPGAGRRRGGRGGGRPGRRLLRLGPQPVPARGEAQRLRLPSLPRQEPGERVHRGPRAGHRRRPRRRLPPSRLAVPRPGHGGPRPPDAAVEELPPPRVQAPVAPADAPVRDRVVGPGGGPVRLLRAAEPERWGGDRRAARGPAGGAGDGGGGDGGGDGEDADAARCDAETRLAVAGTLQNLSDEPANLIQFTIVRDCIGTIARVANEDVESGEVTDLTQFMAKNALASLSHWFRKIATSGSERIAVGGAGGFPPGGASPGAGGGRRSFSRRGSILWVANTLTLDESKTDSSLVQGLAGGISKNVVLNDG
ncbi:hypothetical protein THAOC_35880, partial [Thalassiosira oceanica]